MFGWKLFGFRFCTSANELDITNIEQKDDKINMSGIVMGGALGFRDYHYKIEGSELTIGVKCGFGGSGNFSIEIPAEVKITKVILKGGGKQKEYTNIVYENE